MSLLLAVDCGSLTNPANGQVDTSSGTTFGSTATYTCAIGYTLSGSQSRTCGADGNWTSSEPSCNGKLFSLVEHASPVMHLINKVVDCGSLTDPDNGQVNTPSVTTFGSTATYTCNMGYMLSHQQTVMCSSNGTWSPASPSCDGENANAPITVELMSYTNTISYSRYELWLSL